MNNHGPPRLLLDIEGTVGSLAFVRDTLFPYARTRLRPFVQANHVEPSIAELLRAVAQEAGVDARDRDGQIAALERWSDEDRKITALKALQGRIWADGYADGSLRAHLYADAVRALQRWDRDGRKTFIYSSGSVEAQQLYFGHTEFGDLRPLISGYFDTTVGPKRQAGSYRAISDDAGAPAGRFVFFSDIAEELHAAEQAGLSAIQVRRQPPPTPFEPFITSFDELDY